jgi:hypothetical protein
MKKSIIALIVLAGMLFSVLQVNARAANYQTAMFNKYQGTLAKGEIRGFELDSYQEEGWAVYFQASAQLDCNITDLRGEQTLLSNNGTYIDSSDKYTEYRITDANWSITDINATSIWLVAQNQGNSPVQYLIVSFGGNYPSALQPLTVWAWIAGVIIAILVLWVYQHWRYNKCNRI